MGIYAISDLHLSLFRSKPMDIFGDNWKDHHVKIKKNWESKITNSDLVLMPGDISWAMSILEASTDLEFIEKLPGKKIILPGNHDYWWGSTSKLNNMYKSIRFMKNSYIMYDKIAICGTRGWVLPNDTFYTEHDEKIYKREILRMKMSLDLAIFENKNLKEIILMMHYPPTNDKKEESGFTKLIKEYPIKIVLYGHLHGQKAFESSIKGMYEEVMYYLISSDYIKFDPIKIL